ncbi:MULTISPECIES: VOC family protein [unclassified Caulobacter]|jgi:catechol 2,3-dioxygenase-like lactoylglutathione lyase family enzyme|uniref:VOC family protein n=1 Tax=unclassified Caulobacter TaxID=2648921 RepID=UPI0006F4F154|nr:MULTISPECIES: VOC family protein [unclassified Caulobacter]KQV58232.1 hypothetical protein ASC62_05360 [Caulobacter sp. Root342]KQV69263.1 hypothetical protein ASC70_10675 [Caulobacter sp. Root343]
MDLILKRITLFSADVTRLAAFYRDVIGLPVVGTEEGWVELNAGGCNIAIHAGASKVGNRPPKIVFQAADVGTARVNLILRGFKGLGPVKSTPVFDMCDGRDPDGNAIQISSRP